ncbi:putative zinc finger protein [Orchesella cincta]|uniref:Putative zinc finger protein n=1 Tax=Orchesella cincta TaxID=48709 RepID=A0A1D2MXN3_ORCCI|nr:putative zinc finger protein [Orchesella cincta]
MAAGGIAVCFICLDSFNPSDATPEGHQSHGTSRRSRRRRAARQRHSQHGVNDNLLQDFCEFLTNYLKLPSIELPDHEKTGLMCPSCLPLITALCAYHKQLRVIETRITRILEEVGELMIAEDPKFSECLSKLGEQLKRKIPYSPSFVEKIRSVIALKCTLKGKEMELSGGDLEQEECSSDEDIDKQPGGDPKLAKSIIKAEPMDMDNVEAASRASLVDNIADFDDNLLDDVDEIPEWSYGDEKHEKKQVSDEESLKSGSESEWSEDEKSQQKRGEKRKRTAITPGPAAGGSSNKLETEGRLSVCQLCKKALNHLTRHEYAKHIYAHDEKEVEKKIQCNFCWMSFAFPQTYTYHLMVRHGDANPTFPCENEHCEVSLSSVDELNSHLKTHSGDLFFCSTCNYGFFSPDMCELHELIHRRSVRVIYNCCTSTSTFFYRDHYNLRHGAQLKFHKCSNCSVTCLSVRSLKNHMKRHDEGNSSSLPHPHQCCELCGQTYKGPKGEERLQRHMTNKHGGDKLACQICDQTFLYDSHLDNHMKSVHGLDKFPCTRCDKQLGSTRTMRDHMRIVHAVEPEQHLCPHCGSVFRDMRYMQKHILYMHADLVESEGKYGCPQCNKKFRRNAMMKRHLKTCSGNNGGSEAVKTEEEGATLH